MADARDLRLGRLTRNGVLVGYVAVDTQPWSFRQRTGLRIRRWSETRRRYRLDLLTTWDEGFLTPEDEEDLDQGRFVFKGDTLTYQELLGTERDKIASDSFAEWE